MIRGRNYCPRRRRQAFTLAEVLLTMALLVMITALAWPALERPFATQRLRRAAEKISGQWCGARVQAMDSGLLYSFQFTPGASSFRIQTQSCAESTDDIFAGVDMSPTDDAGQPSATAVPTTSSTLGTSQRQFALPDGITFVGSELAQDNRAAQIQPQTDAASSLDVSWSQPIYFYPDGTTSTARLVLTNQYGRCIELTLRALTGAVTVGEVYTSEEALR